MIKKELPFTFRIYGRKTKDGKFNYHQYPFGWLTVIIAGAVTQGNLNPVEENDFFLIEWEISSSPGGTPGCFFLKGKKLSDPYGEEQELSFTSVLGIQDKEDMSKIDDPQDVSSILLDLSQILFPNSLTIVS